ncbi:type II toxin-antitoxin system HicA family toxin [Adlercreutzia sp. ZJ473]|uniref:type II toxin-antitoxin system HicA family toxin n=1 Tax=Adlercreutzia sp. ZJ473 TaxID=2722822 RepID=UPI0015551F0C|nr:type II toxin-antitoxin system HicA family toxin [Adlercreutzia sp. ZJ473]
MTAREAARLTRKLGGRFVRHGGSHDIYANAAGEEFPIPRHPGDLSPKVEQSIKEKLGLR